MFKLRKAKDKIDIELVGDFTPTPVPIQSYEAYVKTKENKQLKDAILKFLDTIVPHAKPIVYVDYSFEIGKINAKEQIADYLIKNLETE